MCSQFYLDAAIEMLRDCDDNELIELVYKLLLSECRN